MVDVTPEMRKNAEGFVAYCNSLPGESRAVEYEIKPGFFDPHGLVGGSCDFVCGDSRSGVHVVDYKNGRHEVDAEENFQLQIYGLPLAHNLQSDNLTLHIYQPNTPGDPATSWRVPHPTLATRRAMFADAAAAQMDPARNHQQITGAHCHWCRGKSGCDAWKAKAHELAALDFQPVPAGRPQLIAPANMTPVQVAAALTWSGQLQNALAEWSGEVQARALVLAEAGNLPGYKIVEGRRGNRKWKDPDKAATIMEFAGIDPRPAGILSPAQAEKAGLAPGALALLTESSPGKPAVAPVDDPRPPMAIASTPAEDFRPVEPAPLQW
jgi:hypothetical protein